MIHPTAIIHPKAELEKNVSIAPFAMIEEGVRIGEGSKINTGAVIKRGTTIGRDNEIGEYSVIGGNPQDTHFNPATPSGVIIKDGNTIREYVTIHRATTQNHHTIIGDQNLLMCHAHIAHDSHIHDHVVIVNSCHLAGFVEVFDHAFISGGTGIHQHVRIGTHTMIAAFSKVNRDVFPYALVEGYHGRYSGLNIVGLRRANINPQVRKEIKQFYDLFFLTISWKKNLARIKQLSLTPVQMKILNFIEEDSKRGFIAHRKFRNPEIN